jgi:mono/diheme cytochrome c family protein
MYRVRNHHRRTPTRRVKVMTPRLETLLIRGLGIAALGLGGSLADVGPGVASDQTPAQARPESTAKPDSPAGVYRSACLQCHDSDGRGDAIRDTFPAIPDFTNPGWHASRTDEDLGRAILHGKGRAMRPMKKKLGSLDVMHMVSFVRAFRGGGVVVPDESEPPSSAPDAAPGDPKPANAPAQPAPPRPSRDTPKAPSAATAPAPAQPRPAARSHTVAALFGRYCSSCHGQDGRGSEARADMPSLPDFSSRSWQAGRHDAHLAASILEGKGALMPAWRGRLSAEQARELVAFLRTLGPPGPVTGGATTNDFSRRFRELQEQWNELDRQVKALSRP